MAVETDPPAHQISDPGPVADRTTVFVRLLNEGTDVWRPANAAHIKNMVYRLSASQTVEGETWQFAPGSLVRVERRMLSDGETLIVVASAS
jgi:hypothetical protein